MIVIKKNSGYVISRDENGEPYIAHAFGDTPGYGQRKNHKYLLKVKSGLGYRYLYTQAEVDAYYDTRHKSLSQISKDRKKATPTKEYKSIVQEQAKGAERTYNEVRKKFDAAVKNDDKKKMQELYKELDKAFETRQHYQALMKNFEMGEKSRQVDKLTKEEVKKGLQELKNILSVNKK